MQSVPVRTSTNITCQFHGNLKLNNENNYSEQILQSISHHVFAITALQIVIFFHML